MVGGEVVVGKGNGSGSGGGSGSSSGGARAGNWRDAVTSARVPSWTGVDKWSVLQARPGWFRDDGAQHDDMHDTRAQKKGVVYKNERE
jgi:hypothetical protein